MNIYVGNLNYEVSSETLKALFEQYGEVADCRIIIDRNTQRSRGFGFVEMANEADGEKAMEALNGSEFEGRTLVVRKAIRNE